MSQFAEENFEIQPQHYAFLATEEALDGIYQRILDAGLEHSADPQHWRGERVGVRRPPCPARRAGRPASAGVVSGRVLTLFGHGGHRHRPLRVRALLELFLDAPAVVESH